MFPVLSGVIVRIFKTSIVKIILESKDNIFYFFIQVVGNLILYSLPVVFGGAIVGLILGGLGSFIVGPISKGKIKAQRGALYGGIAGGIFLGLLPVWFGFGGIY